jgi:flagellin
MVIQHNISAVNSYRQLNTNQNALSKNLEKLSSGYRINRAADDAAGLAISESMRSKINGLDQAEANANDAIGLIQTEEGALTETHSMLQRMTTLATQAANGTYATSEEGQTARDSIQKEVDELADEITRIAQNTKYNGLSPLDGANSASGVKYTVNQAGAAATMISSTNSVDGTTIQNAADTSYVIKTGADGKQTVAGTFTTDDAKAALKDQAAELNKNAGANISYEVLTKAEISAYNKGTSGVNSAVTGIASQADNSHTAYIVKIDSTSGSESASLATDSNGTTIKSDTDDLASKAQQSLTDAGATIQLQVGPTSGETLTVNQTDMTFAGLFGASNKTNGHAAQSGLTTGVNTDGTNKVLDMSTVDNANKAIDSIKNAINSVSSYRADLGAKQNRLEHTINNLKTTNENVTAAESRIRDTDMAKEIASYTKNNILSQAAQSMLAQANQSGQGVLTLLRG